MKTWLAIIGLTLAIGCSDDDEGTGGADASVGGDASVPEGDVLLDTPDDDDPALAELFDEDAFETFELTISEANLKILDDDPTAEEYVEGEFTYDGKTQPVGIRYKGSIGAWYKPGGEACVGSGGFTGDVPTGPKTCQKLSMKISFNEYDPEGRFMGLKKLLFHSLNQDSSLMRERIAYALFRDLGVAAPRVAHAKLMVNGELEGVFALVEYIDGRFTQSRWGGGDGNLYKEVWPATDEKFVENTDERLLESLRTNEDPIEGEPEPSFDGFRGFEQAMGEAEGDDAQLDTMREWSDMDYMLRYIAADRASAHNDGILHFYPGPTNDAPWSNHNFYWYESEEQDRFWLIPWDMDNSWNHENPVTNIVSPWNDKEIGCQKQIVEGFGIAQIPPSCSPIIRAAAHEDLAEKFNEHVAHLLDGPLSEEEVDAKIEHYSQQIEATVEEASAYDGELSVASWEMGKNELRSAIEVTRNELRAMIGRDVVEVESVIIGGLVSASMDESLPIEGVEVCVHDHDELPCATTDANGAFQIVDAPVNSEFVLTFDKDGMVPVARNFVIAETNYSGTLMEATILWPLEDEGVPLPKPGTGRIQAFPYGASAGHVLTVDPDPGVPILYYTPDSSSPGGAVPDESLTESTLAGLVILNDVEPGEYHASFSGACMGFPSPVWGLPATDGTSAVRLRVIADYIMVAVVQICSGP